MNKYELEVKHIGGDKLLSRVAKEFTGAYHIVGRTPEHIVIGDKDKNVSFCLIKDRVLERYVFEKSRGLERKR